MLWHIPAFTLIDVGSCIIIMMLWHTCTIIMMLWRNSWDALLLQWTDYLALVGDASDNLPGVKGIGEKGAKELLQKFGNMDNLLASTDDVRMNPSELSLMLTSA